MKFFYINNEQCTNCGRCAEVCPTGAIYLSEERYYINYDKCTSCGSCMKACAVDAITVESMDKIVRDADKVQGYKTYIQRLEYELIQLKEYIRIADNNLNKVIAMLPLPAFIANKQNRITIANKSLIEMLDIDPMMQLDMADNLAGESLNALLPSDILRFVKQGRTESSFCHIAELNSRRVSICIYNLGDDSFMGILRDLSEPAAVREEVSLRLKEAIERQMATVQKIGFLLGEEVSMVVNNLNSVIQIVEGHSDKNTGI